MPEAKIPATTSATLAVSEELRARAAELIRESVGALGRQVYHPQLGITTPQEAMYAQMYAQRYGWGTDRHPY